MAQILSAKCYHVFIAGSYLHVNQTDLPTTTKFNNIDVMPELDLRIFNMLIVSPDIFIMNYLFKMSSRFTGILFNDRGN